MAAADAALESGSGEGLARKVADKVKKGIQTRFVRTLGLKKHAEESVGAGRAFVEAYVEFIHYVERLHLDAEGSSVHTQAEAGTHRLRAAVKERMMVSPRPPVGHAAIIRNLFFST